MPIPWMGSKEIAVSAQSRCRPAAFPLSNSKGQKHRANTNLTPTPAPACQQS